jgi:hypothetical protein
MTFSFPAATREPYLQAVSRGCTADPIPVREPLCRGHALREAIPKAGSPAVRPHILRNHREACILPSGTGPLVCVQPSRRVRRSNLTGKVKWGVMPIDDRGRPETVKERRSRALRERVTATGLAWAVILILLVLVLASMVLRMFL